MINPTKIKIKKYLLIKISKKLFLFLNGIYSNTSLKQNSKIMTILLKP